MTQSTSGYISPDWPAPANVRAATTTRLGGVSAPPFDSFNLATHVSDDPSAVAANRAQLRQQLQLPAEPCWLNQTHSTRVVVASAANSDCDADGSVSRRPGEVCVVMTADCLPVLLCDKSGTVVAAAHAGWRGLASGVLRNAVAAMGMPPGHLMAWFGPAIGQGKFEVGDDVMAGFQANALCAVHRAAIPAAFRAGVAQGKWLADLYQLARLELTQLGVTDIYGGGECTASDAARFFSYRRDGACGRMATLIWLAESAPL